VTQDTGGPAVVATGLEKRFGTVRALDGLDLEVPRGAVCGLLGPNGAGKTTAVRIFATLTRPDGGRAEVAGHDVVRHPDRVRYRIGLVGQSAAVDEILSARQNLVMFGRLFHLPPSAARRRADELLQRFDLADTGGKPIKQFSGGMRRRLDLACSLILAPAVLFLDEPTTGLDPRGRNEVWDAIRLLVRGGTTVLLTTQYLDEADQLADRIVVIDAGQAIAEGTPTALKAQLGGDRLEIVTHRADDLPTVAALLERIGTGDGAVEVDADNRRASGPVRDRMAALTEAMRALEAAGVDAEDVALRRPTLDEVFLHLTGRRTRHRASPVGESTSPLTDTEAAA
jgi:ABC-2 type transport system ATP-binding protein